MTGFVLAQQRPLYAPTSHGWLRQPPLIYIVWVVSTFCLYITLAFCRQRRTLGSLGSCSWLHLVSLGMYGIGKLSLSSSFSWRLGMCARLAYIRLYSLRLGMCARSACTYFGWACAPGFRLHLLRLGMCARLLHLHLLGQPARELDLPARRSTRALPSTSRVLAYRITVNISSGSSEILWFRFLPILPYRSHGR